MKFSIQSLREQGNKVRVKHCRKYKSLPGEYLTRGQYETATNILQKSPYGKTVSPKGGMTVVQITTPEGEELEGIAVCSDRDSYNRKKGLAIALGRAISGKMH